MSGGAVSRRSNAAEYAILKQEQARAPEANAGKNCMASPRESREHAGEDRVHVAELPFQVECAFDRRTI